MLWYYANTFIHAKDVTTGKITKCWELILFRACTDLAFCIPSFSPQCCDASFILTFSVSVVVAVSVHLMPVIFRAEALSELTAGRLWFNSDRSTAFKAISSLFVSTPSLFFSHLPHRPLFPLHSSPSISSSVLFFFPISLSPSYFKPISVLFFSLFFTICIVSSYTFIPPFQLVHANLIFSFQLFHFHKNCSYYSLFFLFSCSFFFPSFPHFFLVQFEVLYCCLCVMKLYLSSSSSSLLHSSSLTIFSTSLSSTAPIRYAPSCQAEKRELHHFEQIHVETNIKQRNF